MDWTLKAKIVLQLINNIIITYLNKVNLFYKRKTLNTDGGSLSITS